MQDNSLSFSYNELEFQRGIKKGHQSFWGGKFENISSFLPIEKVFRETYL